MTETPEEIRARIDRTRESVSGDVDALAEKVSPSGIVGRETQRVKGKVNDVKERLFGANDYDPGAVGRVGEDVKQSADRAVQKAKGNPLAVGLIAFGVGALVASLIPSSDQEKQVAAKVKEAAEPVVEEAKDVAKEMGEHLKQPAQDAAQSVKETAQSASEHVKGEAQGAASDVQADAQQAQQRVQDQAKSS